MAGLVTLTTDFEERDPFAASVKGVLYSRCPGVQVCDLSHETPRNNILEGALFLAGAVPFFPKGTVHLVVVAPGKRCIVVSIDGQYVVCPDNGVISILAERHPMTEVREITNPDFILSESGQTFFGRDVFAPAAAHLASGGAFAEIGRHIDDVALPKVAQPKKESDKLVSGLIMHIDRFGNLVTNIHRSFLDSVRVSNVEVGKFGVGPLVRSYGEVAPGAPLAIYGSAGYLEIAYNGDRAESRLKMNVGVIVKVAVEPGTA